MTDVQIAFGSALLGAFIGALVGGIAQSVGAHYTAKLERRATQRGEVHSLLVDHHLPSRLPDPTLFKLVAVARATSRRDFKKAKELSTLRAKEYEGQDCDLDEWTPELTEHVFSYQAKFDAATNAYLLWLSKKLR